MDTATYFEMVLTILLWLTLATLILIFMYMFHGKEEETPQTSVKSKVIHNLKKALSMTGRFLSIFYS